MKKKKILIVDDSHTVLKAMEIKLAAAGYDTATAADGSEALEKAGKIHPDLVIMDVNFPPDVSQSGITWDGFRVMEWMRHTGSAGIAPAIFITSDDINEHKNRALAVGAAAVFQKPFSPADLLETIEECLERVVSPRSS